MIARRDFLLGAAASSLIIASPRGAFAQGAEFQVGIPHRSVGIVEYAFDAGSERLFAYGRSGSANGRPLDGDTVFEIGSITKVFTALLLAEMVTRGEVTLDDPVAKYLPDHVRMPARDGQQVTLRELATHTSGLPRRPGGMSVAGENPYADVTVERLYEDLPNVTLRYDPGTRYRYSNLGVGLLGHALARRANQPYEELLMSRICVPLGLQDTRITLNASMRERLAQGHDKSLRPTSNWDLAALAGAGALRSTANDLLKFMRATCLSEADARLRPAIDLLLQTRRAVRFPDLEQALGWFVRSGDDDQIIYHTGGTGGYASHIGFSTRLQSGAIILSNAADPIVYQAALPLMNPAYKVAGVQFPRQVPVDAAVLASYEGVYRVTPTFALTIRAGAGKLFVRGTGQAEYPLFAQSERSFFMYFTDAQAVFVRNADGKVDQLLWLQARKPYSCVRVA